MIIRNLITEVIIQKLTFELFLVFSIFFAEILKFRHISIADQNHISIAYTTVTALAYQLRTVYRNIYLALVIFRTVLQLYTRQRRLRHQLDERRRSRHAATVTYIKQESNEIPASQKRFEKEKGEFLIPVHRKLAADEISTLEYITRIGYKFGAKTDF